MSTLSHIPVLPQEVTQVLSPTQGETYLDCTAGRGGHAAAMGKLVGRGGTIILNDADVGNLKVAEAHVQAEAGSVGLRTFQGNFAKLPREMESAGLRADMVLADLGFSSTQIEDASRGFSFMRAGPLDMRFDAGRGMPASELVNKAPERELVRIIREFGEDPAAGRIARAIIDARKEAPIDTTDRLADVIRGVVGRKPGGVDPATKTFQALRIVVNDEIGSLEALLAQIARAAENLAKQGSKWGGWLAGGARVAVLTFHSLEDRPVKASFADICKRGLAEDLARGGTVASDEEIRANPRARSARLRAIRLLGRA